MFKKLFGKLFGAKAAGPDAPQSAPASVPAPPAEDELDALIARAADTHARDDRERVLAALKGRKLFMNLNRDAEGRMTMRSATLDGGLTPVILYATEDHPDLAKPTGAIVWEVALGMVGEMPENAGLLLQSRGTGWIAIDKKGAAAILARP